MVPRILIIEKDAGTRRLFEAVARTKAWESDAVETGLQGLLLLRHATYDALVVDMMAPGANGTKILEHLEETTPDLLAASIVVSASSEPTLQKMRERFPTASVVRKPFELPEMMETLERIRRPHVRESDPFATFVRRSVVAGARSGLVVETDGSSVSLVRAFGYDPATYERWFPMSVDAPYPICAAIRQGTMVCFGTPAKAAADFPNLAVPLQQMATLSLAAVPLLHDDRVVGAAGWSFQESRSFPDEARAQLQTIAGIAAPLLAS
jgi:CheY-like chemotaxis protein